jgi:hypothetical protein
MNEGEKYENFRLSPLKKVIFERCAREGRGYFGKKRKKPLTRRTACDKIT